MFKNLFETCIKLARHKFSKHFLAFVSFVESSFFPIPPDVMIIPMVIAKKDDYLKIFFITTVFSVLGGLFGYFIGSAFFEIAIKVIEFYNYEDKVFELQDKLSQNAGIFFWLGTLFLAGFTPLPYKVFTITSGMIGFNFYLFVLISIISRGLRFFIVSYLTMKFGEKFEQFFMRSGGKWFTISGLIIVLVVLSIYLFIK
tara:strand:- start:434 stop:1030 length:597 start_codon:yes stop_codon:yes gene_type:complete